VASGKTKGPSKAAVKAAEEGHSSDFKSSNGDSDGELDDSSSSFQEDGELDDSSQSSHSVQ